MTNWAQEGALLCNEAYHRAGEIALKMARPEPEALYNLAVSLRRQGKYQEALETALRSSRIQAEPNWQTSHLIGSLALDVGDVQMALRWLRSTAHMDGRKRFDHALALLAAGHFEDGFAAYEGRLEQRYQPLPMWHGGSNPGKLAITCEQGLGDSIMFARFLEYVPGDWFVLAPLELQRIMPKAVNPNAGWSATHMVPLMSLPHKLGLKEIPPWKPYICPRERFRVERLPETRLNVGLVWRSKSGGLMRKPEEIEHGERKSVPLEELLPLALVPGVKLHSLQHEGTADIGRLGAGPLIENLGARCLDFQDLAAFIHEMDIVVSVDTGPAHLAGAMGKRTIVMHPYAMSWQHYQPWYPNHTHIRQTTPGDWGPVIEQATQHLLNCAKNGGVLGVQTHKDGKS